MTVVAGYQNFDTKEATYAFVKKLRPQVNLNEDQMAAAQAYIHDQQRAADI